MDNRKKRLLALLGVAAIAVVCCLPMIFAFGSGENARNRFMAAMGAVIVIPVLIYICMMAVRVFGKRNPDSEVIRNIVFDVGRVLMDYDWRKHLESFHLPEEEFRKIGEAVFLSDTWNERDRGLLEEEDYIRAFIEKAPEYEADIRRVMETAQHSVELYDYAETWVKYLKQKGYSLYILSNYSTDMLKKTRAHMPFLKYMDGVVFSCEVKMIKPEREIYDYLLSRYHLNPSRTVFLDDREENCEGARKAGIHAIRFTGLQEAVQELKKLGVE